MNSPIEQSLLSILQRGITEARSSALCGDFQTAADLLDALDNIPRHLQAWSPQSEHEISEQLSTFQRAHPEHATDYVGLLGQRCGAL